MTREPVMVCVCGHSEEEHPNRKECQYEIVDFSETMDLREPYKCGCVVYEEEGDDDEAAK